MTPLSPAPARADVPDIVREVVKGRGLFRHGHGLRLVLDGEQLFGNLRLDVFADLRDLGHADFRRVGRNRRRGAASATAGCSTSAAGCTSSGDGRGGLQYLDLFLHDGRNGHRLPDGCRGLFLRNRGRGWFRFRRPGGAASSAAFCAANLACSASLSVASTSLMMSIFRPVNFAGETRVLPLFSNGKGELALRHDGGRGLFLLFDLHLHHERRAEASS